MRRMMPTVESAHNQRESPESHGVHPIVALVALSLTVFLALFSWLLVGEACVNSEHLRPGTARGVVCEVNLPNWHKAEAHASIGDGVHEWLLAFLPVLVVAAGVGASRNRHRWRPFWLSLLVALLLVVAPVAGLILLPSN
jgi:hypothetical protein